MLLPAAVSAYYSEWASMKAFLICALPTLTAGLFLTHFIHVPQGIALRMRDGFMIVALSWIAMSFIGCLPFMITGSIPDFASAYFETASGFSTTGATVIGDMQTLSKGILFWRSFTHWIGGMGVLVFTVALLPRLGIGGRQIMRAETTGPTMDKISFTTNETARMLYKMYIVMTLIQLTLLVAGGMSIYDSALHTFGTVGTGGFSNYNASVGAYGNFYFEMVIAIFMMLCGVNFSLYSNIAKGTPLRIFKDFELRFYLGIVAASTAFITAMLYIENFYGSIVQAFRYAYFQVSSIMTTTGYATADFDLWPNSCKFILFLLMITGACAGSTAGGIKVIRFAFILKLVKRGIFRRMHPRAVTPIKLAGNVVSSDTVSGVASFVSLYFLTAALSTALISLEGVSLISAASSVIACLSNVGPGFEAVGPTLNYGFYSPASKMLLSFLMIAGRLELYTIMLLFTPAFWNRKR